MREYAGALHEIARIHERIAEWMPDGMTVDAKGLTQTLEAYTRISTFLGHVVAAYSDHTLAKGVGELAGAVAEIRRLTGRLPRDESPTYFPGNDAVDEAIIKTEARRKKKP